MKDKLYFCFKTSLFSLLLVLTFWPLSNEPTFAVTLPGETCIVNPHPKWTPQEIWVWTQVCVGKVADLNTFEALREPLDSRKPEGWSKDRIISPSFLETILLHEPYRGTIGRNGVDIVGAWFREPLSLSNASISNLLALRNSRFDSDVTFSLLKTPFSVSLAGSKFNGNVNMDGLVTDGNLILGNNAEFSKAVFLNHAKIGRQLVMSASRFNGVVNMNSIEVADTLFMDKANFDAGSPKNVNQSVDLRGAKIGAALEMDGSKFNVRLDMGALQTGRGLFMKRGATFGKGVNLSRARIGSELSMTGSKFKGKLNMYNIQVGDDLFMNTEQSSERTEFDEIVLTGAKIGSKLVMSDSSFKNIVIMDSVDVGDSLFMSKSIFDASVTLIGAKIRSLLDMTGSTFKNAINFSGAKVGNLLIMIDSSFKNIVTMESVDVGISLFMRNAMFEASVILSGAKIGNQLDMTGSMFSEDVNLSGARISGQLSTSNSRFRRALTMSNIQVGSDLLMLTDNPSKRAEFADVILSGAKIGGQVTMSGSKFNGVLHMDNIMINGSLILRNEAEFSKALSLGGAHISGQLDMSRSNFSGTVNMNGADVVGMILMHGAKFDASSSDQDEQLLDLRVAKVSSFIEMNDSTFNVNLNFSGLQVGGALLMYRSDFLKSVNLYSAHIGSEFSMVGSRVKGKLDLNNIRVGGNLIMITDIQSARAEFNEIVLFGAHISNSLSMVGSKVKGKLDLNGVRVDGGLFMNAEKQVARTEFAEVDMTGAQIGVQLNMIGSKFNKIVEMGGIELNGSLLLREATFDEQVGASNAEIGSVDLSGGSFSSLNLSGTKIKGELRIGSDSQSPTKWAKGAKLILQNTEVKALQDCDICWPLELEMTGFTYSLLGDLTSTENRSMATRRGAWLKEWLEKQKLYTPQPYEQLAKVLKEAGYISKASDVLYWSKDREKYNSKSADSYWLTLLKWTIGYGYKLHYIFCWLFGFTAFGTIFLIRSRQGPGQEVIEQKCICNYFKKIVDNFLYSLDMLLPIIKLGEWKTVELNGCIKYYFYFHKLMGYVLSFVVIAWLTGIVYR